MTTAEPVAHPSAVLPGARVLKIPPPMYYGAAFVVGTLLSKLTVTWAIGGRPVTGPVGGALLGVGVGLAIAGVVTVVRQRTTIVPHHAVSKLVTSGVYRVTRNPMYAGLAIAYLGGSLVLGSWWPVVLLPLALLAVRRLVIDPEEHYLAEHFGARYVDYRRRVRRWL